MKSLYRLYRADDVYFGKKGGGLTKAIIDDIGNFKRKFGYVPDLVVVSVNHANDVDTGKIPIRVQLVKTIQNRHYMFFPFVERRAKVWNKERHPILL